MHSLKAWKNVLFTNPIERKSMEMFSDFLPAGIVIFLDLPTFPERFIERYFLEKSYSYLHEEKKKSKHIKKIWHFWAAYYWSHSVGLCKNTFQTPNPGENLIWYWDRLGTTLFPGFGIVLLYFDTHTFCKLLCFLISRTFKTNFVHLFYRKHHSSCGRFSWIKSEQSHNKLAIPWF